jgi:tyrosinase
MLSAMLLPLFSAFLGVVSALPSAANVAARQTACNSPALRKDWAKASTQERLAYLDAAVCVTKKPSRLKKHPDATLHDDFALAHASLNHWSRSSSSSPVDTS